MANQPGGSGVGGEVLYSLCARCGHDRFDAVDCEHGQACPMPKGSRTHEECVECPFRRVEPQPCNGHLMGPSACGDRVRLTQADRMRSSADNWRRQCELLENVNSAPASWPLG